MERLERELTELLNRHCAENPSNTPDFILAQFLLGCLAAWNTSVNQRETWYGREARSITLPMESCDGRYAVGAGYLDLLVPTRMCEKPKWHKGPCGPALAEEKP